jgi:DNA-binding transcriptional regulator LsrR (DeoR family)
MLRKYMAKSDKSLKALQNAGCVGDMLWRPLGERGPIETESEIRAMTLVELSDLPKFIAGGKHVLLVLGPCVVCNRPKTEMLRAVLTMPPRLITHLVVDSRSAAGVLHPE